MTASYLIAAGRTPIGTLLGQCAHLSAPELGAAALRGALAQAGLSGGEVDEVVLGHVVSAGVGQAPARQAALCAGLPESLPAYSVNKVCGSSLWAVILADRAIRVGEARVVLAGGMESMSRAPFLLPGVRSGWKFGHVQSLDSLLHDGLFCATEQQPMGVLADAVAKQHGACRAAQDAWAAQSHARALAAQQGGAFAAEIVPLPAARGGGQIDRDEGPRQTSADELAALRPAFGAQGTVTAGNASQLSDGAAAVVVADEATARRIRTPWQFRIVACAESAVAPRDLFTAPIPAIERVLAKAGLRAEDVDLFELNEAFAAQVLACIEPLQLDPARINVDGGAIALGHPIGASGARVLTTLAHSLVRRGQERGVAALCLGGGGAVAVLIERTA